LIDLLVYNEINNKGRRVFLDYRKNPSRAMHNGQFDFSLLSEEAHQYLERSELLFGTPIERLSKMNMPAVKLYLINGIDLEQELLEIAVCAQHCNGGLQGDCWWESNVSHFFPVGEVNGSSGVYRPGGSALNATQVGGLRAAQYIARNYSEAPLPIEKFLLTVTHQVQRKLGMADYLSNTSNEPHNLKQRTAFLRSRMTKAGAFVRNLVQIDEAITQCRNELKEFPAGVGLASAQDLPNAFRYYDMLITQTVYLSAIREYMQKGGQSRGSYIVSKDSGELPALGLSDMFRYQLDDGTLMHYICEAGISREKEWSCSFAWIPVRPIPQEEYWFETLWATYRSGAIWRKDKET
jgi:succinate dehydrogenase/fumarate reductase flavoprotein subunit